MPVTTAEITHTINNLAFADNHIVLAITIYRKTINYFDHVLRSYSTDCIFMDLTQLDPVEIFEGTIGDNTKAVFMETIGNHNFINIDAPAKMCHSYGIPLVTDNTFATPYLFRPLDHSADIVIELATKFIGSRHHPGMGHSEEREV